MRKAWLRSVYLKKKKKKFTMFFCVSLDVFVCVDIDVDECKLQNGGCSHTCTNSPGGHTCHCPPPLLLGTDSLTCTSAFLNTELALYMTVCLAWPAILIHSAKTLSYEAGLVLYPLLRGTSTYLLHPKVRQGLMWCLTQKRPRVTIHNSQEMLTNVLDQQVSSPGKQSQIRRSETSSLYRRGKE